MTQAAPAASQTALWAAKQRALHHIHGHEPRILDDPIAERLLDGDVDMTAPAPAGANASSVVLRSRWSEDRLAQAMPRGVTQLVILGAGLDTFAYRQPEWARPLRIFEVDHQASQQDKRRRLAKAGVPFPANLEYVAIDFERTTLREGLKASSLDFRQRTFFSCLGVLGYLTPDAVRAIFQMVAEFPAGSEIAFTYFAQAFPTEASTMTASVGETLLSYFEPEALTQELLGMGFSEVARLSPDDANRRYFQNRTDGLRFPEWPVMSAAVVDGAART